MKIKFEKKSFVMICAFLFVLWMPAVIFPIGEI